MWISAFRPPLMALSGPKKADRSESVSLEILALAVLQTGKQ